MSQYDDQNIFAKILRGELPCNKVYEDENTFVIMDLMPRGDGHCLVLPKKPIRNILDADDESLATLFATTAKIAKAAKKAFDADGVTIQQYNESAGGQVVFHMHVHVIPRFNDVPMKPHTGKVEDQAVLAANAVKIIAAI